MKIQAVESWREKVPLTRPYTIALTTTSEVELFFVKIIADSGEIGLGSAAPFELVTGESDAACALALTEESLADLQGRQIESYEEILQGLASSMSSTPAARAAVDMAILDLLMIGRDQPMVELWGRCHQALPTSITIGIKSTDEAIEEAREYLGRGFTCLKIKLGLSLEEDLERLCKLREVIGAQARIRVDANQGYDASQVQLLSTRVGDLGIEFIEQPLPAAAIADLRSLPRETIDKLAFDESLLGVDAARQLVEEAVPTWVIKLMKCAGPSSGKIMADLAAAAGKQIMWGCMDESRISIAAALHVAYACPATRFLDLDGHLDLAADPARGGFMLQDGQLHLLDAPGLGVELVG